MPDIDRRPSHDVSRPRAVATRLVGSAIAIGAIGWSVHFAGLPRVELEGRLAISPSRADTTYVITESAPLELRRALYERPVVAGGQPANIPAFPEAEGWGAIALQDCRAKPLVVHEVTNTDATGAGSFDAAMNALNSANFDVIVFRTGGHIQFSTSMTYTSARQCVYIAGQTAPGGGITFSGGRIRIDNHDDLVIRHLRHRGKTSIGFNIRESDRVVLSELSTSWAGATGAGGSTNVTLGGEMSDLTIQRQLTFEPDTTHSTVIMLNTGLLTELVEGERMTVVRNAIMGPGWRSPKISASRRAQVVNNVIYNWSGRGSAMSHRQPSTDWINNLHKPGPASPTGGPWANTVIHIHDGCGLSDPEAVCEYGVYISGNHNHHNDFGALPDTPWEGDNRYVGCRDGTSDTSQGGGWCTGNGHVVPESVRRDTALTPSEWLTILPMSDSVRDDVLDRAGHYRRLACDGSWTPVRDEVDSLRVAWFDDSAGPSAIVAVDTMGIPTPASGTACTDTDGDGVPDDWETAQCGSTTCVTADSVSVSGYLMIEHYLNGSDPDDPEPWSVNGNGNGNGEPETTFGSGRRVYVAPLITYGVHEALRPDTAVIPLGTPFRSILNPARDSALVVTGTDLGTPLDSAAVESTVQAWDLCNARGLCSAVDVRDVPIPGGDPGAFLMREWALREAA